MIKKIWSLLLCCCVLWTTSGFAYEVQDYTDTYTSDESCAAALIEALVQPKFDASAEGITREQFLVTLVSLITDSNYFSQDSSFTDLEAGTVASHCAAYAVGAGILSEGSEFFPQDVITVNQAVKMCVAALGYNDVALLKGGYPYGYLSVAKDIDLTDGVMVSDDALTPNAAYSMLYNVMTARVFIVEGADDDSLQYRKDQENLLSKVYDITELEGIVTADPHTSLTNPNGGLDDHFITIGSYTVRLEDTQDAYLGCNVRAYVRKYRDIYAAVCVAPYQTKIVSFSSEDSAQLDGYKLQMEDESGKLKSYSLDMVPSYILNGKNADIADLQAVLTNNEITAQLIDNDNDGTYEVVQINTWKYCYVQTADIYNGWISDANDKANTIDFSDPDCKTDISGITDLYDVAPNMLIAYTVSEDKLYVNMFVCNQKQKGVLNGISDTDSEITLDETTYRFNEYFNEYYRNACVLNETQQILLGMNGEAVALRETVDKAQYGYIIGTDTGSGLDKSKIKLISQDGKIQIYPISDKVCIDDAKSSPTALITAINAMDQKERLVKYKVSGDEIKNVDFAENAVGLPDHTIRPQENSLESYCDGTYIYKSGKGTFADTISARGAKVFIIPESNFKDSGYRVTDMTRFKNDSKYAIKAYDVNSCGEAGAIVYCSDIMNTISAGDASAVVSKISPSVNEEGENCYCIDLYQGTAYSRYYTNDDSEAAVKALQPGDIIQYVLTDDEKYIADVACMYSCMEDKIKSAYSKGGSMDYVKGYVYDMNPATIFAFDSVRGTQLAPVQEKMFVLPMIAELTYVYVSTDKAGIPKKAVVKSIPGQSVTTYLAGGNNASFFVAERRYYEMRTMYVYVFES